MKKTVLGIAGFIGSGKTTVGHCFKTLGADFIDADMVVNELYRSGQAGFKKIRDFFGEEYVKRGVLDRKKLARTIFSDPKKLKILHALIHPLVTAEIQKMIDRSSSALIVLEATWFEKKFLCRLVSRIVWVEIAKELAYKRLKARNLGRAMFEKILKLQAKPDKIDFVIDNSFSKRALRASVKELFAKLNDQFFDRKP